jgi:hypothetical protein
MHKQVRFLIVLMTAIAAGMAVPPSDAAAAKKRCGISYASGAPFGVQVDRGPVSCSTARSVVRRYVRSTAPCAGSGCYRTIRGWTCGSGGAGSPRLFACNKGRRVVGAYLIAD